MSDQTPTPPEAPNPVQLACDAVGGARELARLLNIKPPSVSEWKARGKVPAERCLEVEEKTGVSRYLLRPDVYGQPPVPTSQEGSEQAKAAEQCRPAMVELRALIPFTQW